MQLPKPTPVIIVLLPALAFLPVIKELSEGIHLGGISLLLQFFEAAINPSTDLIVIQNALNGIQVTIAIALISWCLSLLLGVSLGILSSKIFWETFSGYKSIALIFSRLLAIPRAIHEVVWGLLLLQILGLNPLVAIIAIAIPYSSLIARVVSNQIDTLDNHSLIAIKQGGGSSLSAFITSLLPPLVPIISTYGGYRLECALRGATLLGMFGLGGIGTELQLTLQSLEFKELWTSLWILGIVMIFLEKAFSYIRELNGGKIRSRKSSLSKLLLICSLIVIALISLRSIEINLLHINIHSVEWPNLKEIKNAFIELPILKLIGTTIVLTLLSAGIAIGTPPLIVMLWPGKLGSNVIGVVWIFFRLIPPPLTALLLLLCINPSISLAALALGINNMGVMGRLLNENLKHQDNLRLNAIKSSGTTSQIAWLYGKLGPLSKSYLALAAYRADVLLRETAIVGIVGGVGLGWQLQESLSSFDWAQVMIITATFSLLTISGEFVFNTNRNYLLENSTNNFIY